MTNTVTIYSTDELEKHKTTILSNLAKSVWDIRAIIESENAQEVFRQFKFEKIATEPLSGKPENLVEVINQSQTYFVTLAALGLPSYGVREFAKIREKKKNRNKLFTELLLVNVISTTLAIIGFVGLGTINDGFNGQ